MTRSKEKKRSASACAPSKVSATAPSLARHPSSCSIRKNTGEERRAAFSAKPAGLEKRDETELSLLSGKAITFSSNWIQLQKQFGEGHATLKRKRKLEGSLPDHGILGNNRPSIRSLVPLNTDCSVTRVLALDCEMVGVGYKGKRNSLTRVSLVNLSGNAVYDKNVRPVEFVTDCRTKITGVRVCDLKQGEKFIIVQKEVSELLRGRILVGHALHNDLKVLLLSHPRKDMRDTATYEHLQSKIGRPQSLKCLVDKYLGCNIQEKAHSSVEDARAAMFLYIRFKDEWEKNRIRRGLSK